VTLGPLLIAGVLASPALWRALEQHQLPLYVALERLLVIAVICVVVGDAVRRYLDVVPTLEAAASAAPEASAPGPSAVTAASPTPDPVPFELTPEWGGSSLGSGALDADDLFALDPLPGEDPHPATG
jgi:hypothetical protein